MSINYAAMVREFMALAPGQTVPFMAHTGDETLTKFREGLIGEEFDELVNAMADGDLEGIADGCADLLYVVFGTALAFGIPIDAVFAEVHRSNMSKKFPDGTFHTNDAGKVIKPPDFTPPNLVPILEACGAQLTEVK